MIPHMVINDDKQDRTAARNGDEQYPPKRNARKSSPEDHPEEDESTRAIDRELLDQAVNTWKNLPDTRAKKIVLIKQRLASGYYDTPEARELLVSKLVHFLKSRSD